MWNVIDSQRKVVVRYTETTRVLGPRPRTVSAISHCRASAKQGCSTREQFIAVNTLSNEFTLLLQNTPHSTTKSVSNDCSHENEDAWHSLGTLLIASENKSYRYDTQHLCPEMADCLVGVQVSEPSLRASVHQALFNKSPGTATLTTATLATLMSKIFLKHNLQRMHHTHFALHVVNHAHTQTIHDSSVPSLPDNIQPPNKTKKSRAL